ncbi:MAG: hypothetical protein KBT34_02750 [Prevotella sp.]|nr:hypothetical protein [Candidatus Prevotella equi]
MAKTIEERADEFAEREYINDQYEKERISFGYYHGAIEQRKRDIELFGEWLEEHVMDYVSYDHLNGIDIDYSNITKGLRKALEEER